MSYYPQQLSILDESPQKKLENSMTASSGDVLGYVNELEQSGLSHEQAAAIARGVDTMMHRRVETLVTRAHFDTELATVKSRFEMVNQRLDNLEIALRKLEAIPAELKLHTWMLALITVVLVVPKLQEWFAS